MKSFYSRLYRKEILPSDKEYWEIVQKELDFRINELQKENCTCMHCRGELEKYKKYLRKLERSGNVNKF